MLGLKLDAAVVNGGSKPVKGLMSLEVLPDGQFKEAGFTETAGIPLISGSLQTSLEDIGPATSKCRDLHGPYCGEAARFSTNLELPRGLYSQLAR